MKNTTEILKELKKKFATYKQSRDFWMKQADMEGELHHWKAQKQNEEFARENQVRMSLIVDMYETITGLDVIDVVHTLMKEESK